MKDVGEQFLDSGASATNSGSSTPYAFAEDAWSSASSPLLRPSHDPDEVSSFPGWDAIPTPESSPCRVATRTRPSTLSASLHPQVQALLAQPAAGELHSSRAEAFSPPGPHSTPSFNVSDDGSVRFVFTHRRAQGVEWGLCVTRAIVSASAAESLEALLVHDVMQGGAIDSWNRQVISTDGPMAMKVVQAGDLIVAVNDKRGCESMVGESNSSMLMKMQVLRQKSDH